MFWFLLFPIILASAEYLAFKDILTTTPIDTIELGITQQEEYEIDDILSGVLTSAEFEEGKKLFHISSYNTLEELNEATRTKTVSAMIYQEQGNTQIKGNSAIELSILQSVTVQTNIAIDLITQAYEQYYKELASGGNPTTVNEEAIIQSLVQDADYLEDTSKDKDGTAMIMYLYAILALSCMYASIMGLRCMNDLRADRSSLGIRISVGAYSKTKLAAIYFAACLIFQIVGSCILFLFYRFVLGISLGNALLVIPTLILGGITGIVLGMLIGTFVGGSDRVRESILSMGSLLFCILAGMCSIQIKNMINQSAPFLNYINPASLITDALYALYYYDTYDMYLISISVLAAISIVGLIVVFIKTRSQKYASL